MAIDYIIDYACVPKSTLGTDGILERLKGRERAESVIQLFRKNGDNRPPAQMGFEFTRSTPDGQEETRVVVVQDLLDAAEELQPLAHYCQGCPANANNQPFGCINYIEYPISRQGEIWLLNQLPTPEEPLVWLLLRQGIEEFGYDGSSVKALRGEGLPYFEETGVLARQMGEFYITTNQVFEMTFTLGHIHPSHAGVLLLFFHAIRRDMDADSIMNISQAPADARARYPFLLKPEDGDDRTVRQLKAFLYALYVAWTLNVRLLLDV
jgi:hypothetical protein